MGKKISDIPNIIITSHCNKVNYICKTCSGEGFRPINSSISYIHSFMYSKFLLCTYLILVFSVLQKQSVLVRANECLTIPYSLSNMLEALPLLYCNSHTPSERMSILSFPLATVSLCECCVLSSV